MDKQWIDPPCIAATSASPPPACRAAACGGDDLNSSLAAFAAHDLSEVGALALMSRVDTKYLVDSASLRVLLAAMQPEYSVLEMAGKRLMRYRTDYFDTADFALYHEHHNGRSNRTKVRCRRYVDSDACFLELKAKNNKGRTVKNRVGVEAGREPQDLVPEFLQQCCLPLLAQALGDTLHVSYQRISLQSARHGERVSIDLDLSAGRKDETAAFRMTDMAIVEIKQSQFNPGSPVHQALRRLGVRPGSFSKYCIASALLYPEQLKTNRFKRTLTRIQPYLQSTRGN